MKKTYGKKYLSHVLQVSHASFLNRTSYELQLPNVRIVELVAFIIYFLYLINLRALRYDTEESSNASEGNCLYSILS